MAMQEDPEHNSPTNTQIYTHFYSNSSWRTEGYLNSFCTTKDRLQRERQERQRHGKEGNPQPSPKWCKLQWGGICGGTLSRFVCPAGGMEKKPNSLKGQLEYEETSTRTLWNGRGAAETLSRSKGLASATTEVPFHSDSTNQSRVRAPQLACWLTDPWMSCGTEKQPQFKRETRIYKIQP